MIVADVFRSVDSALVRLIDDARLAARNADDPDRICHLAECAITIEGIRSRWHDELEESLQCRLYQSARQKVKRDIKAQLEETRWTRVSD